MGCRGGPLAEVASADPQISLIVRHYRRIAAQGRLTHFSIQENRTTSIGVMQFPLSSVRGFMKKFLAAIFLLYGAHPASATDSWGSELSHFGGGILVGGAATWLADQWWPEDRLWIGIGTGVVYGVAGEGVQAATGGKFSWLDVVMNITGSTVGAFATDRWILKPVVTHDSSDSTRYELRTGVKF